LFWSAYLQQGRHNPPVETRYPLFPPNLEKEVKDKKPEQASVQSDTNTTFTQEKPADILHAARRPRFEARTYNKGGTIPR
jgi:hypothetical protein